MPKLFEEKIFSIKNSKMSPDQKRAALATISRKSGVPVDKIQSEYFVATKKKVNVAKKRKK